MWRNIGAELLVLRKRPSTWVVFGLWTFLSVGFGYVFPYVAYLSGGSGGGDLARPLVDMLPSRLVATFLEGYPFFGGVIVLILGVLTFGSEYGWGTLKTMYTQGPSRLQLFTAKAMALGMVLIGFVLVPLFLSGLLSYAIALREDEVMAWPDVWMVTRGVLAAWFLLAVWSALGVLLALVSRGTALAIGIGILYGLVIEGLISGLVNEVNVLRPLTEGFLRANGYSLIAPLGVALEQVRSNGPGSFSGPYVGSLQAFLILAAYLGMFCSLSALLLHRRDVS